MRNLNSNQSFIQILKPNSETRNSNSSNLIDIDYEAVAASQRCWYVPFHSAQEWRSRKTASVEVAGSAYSTIRFHHLTKEGSQSLTNWVGFVTLLAHICYQRSFCLAH